MLSPRKRNRCGLVSTTASQIGWGLSWFAQEPKAIRESGGSSATSGPWITEKIESNKRDRIEGVMAEGPGVASSEHGQLGADANARTSSTSLTRLTVLPRRESCSLMS